MKPDMIARKPIWECIPIDIGHAYGISVTYRGKGIWFNTYRAVRWTPGLTHEQAVFNWVIAMQLAIDKGWKP